LRNLENAAHKEWDANNWKINNRTADEGKVAVSEMKTFISSSLEKLFTTDDNTPISVSGLEEFLFIPEDLIPMEDDDIKENPFFGKESGEFDNEGFSMSSVIESKKPESNEPNGSSNAIVVELKRTAAAPDDSGDLGSSNNGKKTKRHSSNHAPGNEPHIEIDDAEEGTFTRNVPVTYRVIATRNLQGQIEHNLIIYTKQEVQNGFIQISISGEQEDEVMDIIFSDHGIPDHNILNNIRLTQGKNNVKIRLEDNMKHSLLLKAYEVK
jgi:hypothetical protein